MQDYIEITVFHDFMRVKIVLLCEVRKLEELATRRFVQVIELESVFSKIHETQNRQTLG